MNSPVTLLGSNVSAVNWQTVIVVHIINMERTCGPTHHVLLQGQSNIPYQPSQINTLYHIQWDQMSYGINSSVFLIFNYKIFF